MRIDVLPDHAILRSCKRGIAPEKPFLEVPMAEPTIPAKPTVRVRPNGPVIVVGLPLLKNSKGEEIHGSF